MTDRYAFCTTITGKRRINDFVLKFDVVIRLFNQKLNREPTSFSDLVIIYGKRFSSN